LVFNKWYKEPVTEWCCTYWNYLSTEQFNLLKYIKVNPTSVDSDLLMLSLCVHVGNDISKFIKSVSAFVRNAESTMDLIYDAIMGKPKQNKITFE